MRKLTFIIYLSLSSLLKFHVAKICAESYSVTNFEARKSTETIFLVLILIMPKTNDAFYYKGAGVGGTRVNL